MPGNAASSNHRPRDETRVPPNFVVPDAECMLRGHHGHRRHSGSCGSSSRGRRGPGAAPGAGCAAKLHCTRMTLRARP